MVTQMNCRRSIEISICIISLLFIVTQAFAQSSTPAPSYTPDPNETKRQIERNRQTTAIFDTLKAVGQRPNDSATNRQIYQLHIVSLYREPTTRELESLSIDQRDLEKYVDLLRSQNTGIVKLVPDSGCAANTAVISANEECLKYTMPGNGSSFSFRKESYRIPRVADIMYSDKVFKTTGVLQHSVLTNIGDVPIESVTDQTAGMRYLTELVPSKTMAEAKKFDDELLSGISSDGSRYGRSSEVTLNSTYLLRAVAYRGNLFRAVQNVVYDELTLDKREDVLIAFRVVRKDADNAITIVWREIRSRKSPRLEKR